MNVSACSSNILTHALDFVIIGASVQLPPNSRLQFSCSEWMHIISCLQTAAEAISREREELLTPYPLITDVMFRFEASISSGSSRCAYILHRFGEYFLKRVET